MVENITYSAGTITYHQGTTAALAIRLKSDANTVIDLTGYTASLEIQKDYASKINDCKIAATISGDTLVFAFTPSTLAGVRLAEGESSRVYQIKVTTVDNAVTIPLSGEFILLKDIA